MNAFELEDDPAPSTVLLSNGQRLCVLRACRAEMGRLQGEMVRLRELQRDTPDVIDALQVARVEHACLASGVRVLWSGWLA